MDGEEGRQKCVVGWVKRQHRKNPFLFIRLLALTAISLFSFQLPWCSKLRWDGNFTQDRHCQQREAFFTLQHWRHSSFLSSSTDDLKAIKISRVFLTFLPSATFRKRWKIRKQQSSSPAEPTIWVTNQLKNFFIAYHLESWERKVRSWIKNEFLIGKFFTIIVFFSVLRALN